MKNPRTKDLIETAQRLQVKVLTELGIGFSDIPCDDLQRIREALENFLENVQPLLEEK